MLESISFPVGLFTEVAGNGDSFQVIQFYVVLYFCVFALLSTHCAHVSSPCPPFPFPCCPLPSQQCSLCLILTFLHQGFHLIINRLKIGEIPLVVKISSSCLSSGFLFPVSHFLFFLFSHFIFYCCSRSCSILCHTNFHFVMFILPFIFCLKLLISIFQCSLSSFTVSLFIWSSSAKARKASIFSLQTFVSPL